MAVESVVARTTSTTSTSGGGGMTEVCATSAGMRIPSTKFIVSCRLPILHGLSTHWEHTGDVRQPDPELLHWQSCLPKVS